MYNVDVIEGPSKQDVVDALPQDGIHREVMETFPTCLVEPVPGAAQKLSDAERKAGVTWGVNAVGATHTSLTGKGVKVSCLCDMMHSPSIPPCHARPCLCHSSACHVGDAPYCGDHIAQCCNGPSFVSRCVQVAVLDTGLDEQYRTHPAFAGITVIGKNFTTKDVSVHLCCPLASRQGLHMSNCMVASAGFSLCRTSSCWVMLHAPSGTHATSYKVRQHVC